MNTISRSVGRGTSAKSLAYCLFLVVLAVSACGKKDAPYDLNQVSGDRFSDNDRSTRMSFLREKLNVNLILEDQSYANEYASNRLVRYLAQNADLLSEKLKNVVEIRIGSHFARKEVSDGKQSLTLDTSANEQKIQEFIDQAPTQFQVESVLRQTSTRGSFRSIVDLKGMSPEEASSFSTKLLAASKGFDLTAPLVSSLCANVVVDRIFAVGSGYLIVPFGASEDDLRKFFGASLELSKTLTADLDKLGALLGVTVSYQPGALVPAEISAGIVALRAASDVFFKSGFQKKAIMIGRRTEGDTALARNSSSLLISFQAAPAEIQSAIGLLVVDGALSTIRSAIRDFVAHYQVAGVNCRITEADFPMEKSGTKGEGASDRISALLVNIGSVASPSRLSQLRVTEMVSNVGILEPVVEARGDGTAILRLNVNAVNSELLNGVLQRYSDSFGGTERIRIQKAILDDLKRSYTGEVLIDYADAGLDTSVPEKTLALERAVDFFRQRATPTRLLQLGIKTVTFRKGAISPIESVIRTGATLTIDPYLALPENLETVLKPAAPVTGRN